MIIKGTLIAKDIDIKVAISVEISVTDVYYQFGSLIGILSTALAKHHANGDTSMVTEIVNLCPIM